MGMGYLLICVKSIFVGGLLFLGVLFLLKGFGKNIRFLKFKGLMVRDLPAGAFLVVAGIALAKFWQVRIEGLGGGVIVFFAAAWIYQMMNRP